MRKPFFMTGLALLAAPLSAAPADLPAPPHGTAPAATQAPATPEPVTPEKIEASRAAIGSADARRLLSDRAYAAEILAHIDRLASATDGNAVARLALDNL